MREYKIKREHSADIAELIYNYFGAKGDISKGFTFSAPGIGSIYAKKDGNSLFIEIDPSKGRGSDYNVIKKWNSFLFETTGMDAKERKKEFSKR